MEKIEIQITIEKLKQKRKINKKSKIVTVKDEDKSDNEDDYHTEHKKIGGKLLDDKFNSFDIEKEMEKELTDDYKSLIDKFEKKSDLDYDYSSSDSDKSDLSLKDKESKNDIKKYTLKFSRVNRRIDDIQLSGLLNYQFHQCTPDKIDDIMKYIKSNILCLKNYCVSCYNKLDIPGDIYLTCEKEECEYEVEEMPLDNKVTEYMRRYSNEFEFLFQSAKYAINSTRKQWIFEPFPRYFLKNKINIKRGKMAALTGESYEELKDYDTITELINKMDAKKLLAMIPELDKDEELEKKIGTAHYNLIRFIILSNKMDFNYCDLIPCRKGLSQFSIKYDMIKEEEIKKKYGKRCLFLFSRKCCF